MTGFKFGLKEVFTCIKSIHAQGTLSAVLFIISDVSFSTYEHMQSDRHTIAAANCLFLAFFFHTLLLAHAIHSGTTDLKAYLLRHQSKQLKKMV